MNKSMNTYFIWTKDDLIPMSFDGCWVAVWPLVTQLTSKDIGESAKPMCNHKDNLISPTIPTVHLSIWFIFTLTLQEFCWALWTEAAP